MKMRLIIILIILPNVISGQYTYFNASFMPAFPNIGSGDASNLISSGDSLMACAFVPMDGINGRRVLVLNENGMLISDLLFPEDTSLHVVGWGDSVFPRSDGGYFWSGSNNGWPIFLRLNNNFEEVSRVEYPAMYTDSSRAGFFQSAECADGDFVSVGRFIHIYGPLPGELYANLILARHTQEGDEEFFREYTLSDLNISIDYDGPSAYPAGGLFELSNGDILLFGSIGNPLDCYAIKFDSEGNYLDHVKWGHAQYGDGSPWPVKIGEDEFAIGYSVYAYTTNDGYIFGRPRIGWLSADNMELSLGNFFDHPVWYGGVTDMERSPDGGFVMLGKGEAEIDNNAPGTAFLLKLDEQGNEEWYKTYSPNEDYFQETAYDLEMTPDGGMAFVGNYFSVASAIDKTWIVKTDACGELEFDGCGPQVAVTEASTEDDLLLVYPNPADGSVQISWKGEAQRMDVFNASGHLVESQAITLWVNSLNVDFGPLAPGIYHLRLVDEHGDSIGQQRLVKQ